jgi:RNA polymerase sigma factor (sigma-70 family)
LALTRTDDDALLAARDHARLLAKYEPLIVARCVAALRGHQDAEDVAQDVKLRLWRELQAGKAYPVPYRVVVSNVITWTLKDYWQGRDTYAPLPDQWDAGGPNPNDNVGAAEAVDDLLRARLTGKTLQVCELRYLEGLEIDQIAQQLGMTRNAVDQALHRAHTRLREALAGG